MLNTCGRSVKALCHRVQITIALFILSNITWKYVWYSANIKAFVQKFIQSFLTWAWVQVRLARSLLRCLSQTLVTSSLWSGIRAVPPSYFNGGCLSTCRWAWAPLTPFSPSSVYCWREKSKSERSNLIEIELTPTLNMDIWIMWARTLRLKGTLLSQSCLYAREWNTFFMAQID